VASSKTISCGSHRAVPEHRIPGGTSATAGVCTGSDDSDRLRANGGVPPVLFPRVSPSDRVFFSGLREHGPHQPTRADAFRRGQFRASVSNRSAGRCVGDPDRIGGEPPHFGVLFAGVYERLPEDCVCGEQSKASVGSSTKSSPRSTGVLSGIGLGSPPKSFPTVNPVSASGVSSLERPVKACLDQAVRSRGGRSGGERSELPSELSLGLNNLSGADRVPSHATYLLAYLQRSGLAWMKSELARVVSRATSCRGGRRCAEGRENPELR
jgi:hypothetical protein